MPAAWPCKKAANTKSRSTRSSKLCTRPDSICSLVTRKHHSPDSRSTSSSVDVDQAYLIGQKEQAGAIAPAVSDHQEYPEYLLADAKSYSPPSLQERQIPKPLALPTM